MPPALWSAFCPILPCHFRVFKYFITFAKEKVNTQLFNSFQSNYLLRCPLGWSYTRCSLMAILLDGKWHHQSPCNAEVFSQYQNIPDRFPNIKFWSFQYVKVDNSNTIDGDFLYSGSYRALVKTWNENELIVSRHWIQLAPFHLLLTRFRFVSEYQNLLLTNVYEGWFSIGSRDNIVKSSSPRSVICACVTRREGVSH